LYLLHPPCGAVVFDYMYNQKTDLDFLPLSGQKS
jgi:hypothetical protein